MVLLMPQEIQPSSLKPALLSKVSPDITWSECGDQLVFIPNFWLKPYGILQSKKGIRSCLRRSVSVIKELQFLGSNFRNI
jgi:hypothetical protein